ncbi:lysoplasmalogenase [Rossellomorea sp. GAMAL-10_SWC]
MKRYLPILILFFGILYMFFIPSEPVSIKILFKLIPMVLIISYAFLQIPYQSTKYRALILLGLISCMIGDGTLIWFVVGLSAFLIGHLFYAAGFISGWKFSIYRVLSIIPIAIYAFFLCSNLVSSLNESGQENLVIPVIAYSVAISIMVFTSIMAGNKWAILGSLLFIISDSILSWDLFVESVKFGHELIMITYYSAQFLIAKSILNRNRVA